jgi:hypothetical protein
MEYCAYAVILHQSVNGAEQSIANERCAISNVHYNSIEFCRYYCGTNLMVGIPHHRGYAVKRHRCDHNTDNDKNRYISSYSHGH